ncbi:MAG: bifunctional homocysteine S-methyltransferase/methylenetetrahydrofolate reductase [Nitrospinota bacterium]
MIPFKEALEKKILVCDGAMGTYLYRKGIYINHSFDQLNLTKPELVREVHREYISAGADIIETNSFGANRHRLAKYGLDDSVKEINLAAARNAAYEARGGVYIAGSVGPLGVELAPLGKLGPGEAISAFEEQISALIEGGADLIIFETFLNSAELGLAVRAARNISKDIPIIAQMSFNDDSATVLGEPVEKVVRFMDGLSVDVIGMNCSVGPAPMLEVISKMASISEKPISAMPNAGQPRLVEGRLIYMTTPEYLATYAKRFIRSGVKIIGGCCGTTPEHIKQLTETAKALSPSRVSVDVQLKKDEEPVQSVPTADKSAFAKKLAEGKFVTCVELLPPKGADPSRVLKQARKLKEAGVDASNIPDGPRAIARMSPMSLALLFKNEAGIDPVLHYTCRDRNILGMQSDILGAHAIGLRDILVVTGDPPKLGNYPDATAVYDVDAIGLVKIINNLNHGLDVSGSRFGAPTAIHIGVGANPVAINFDEEVSRLRQKVESGAEYILTQPVFDPDKFLHFMEAIEDIKTPILIGILPLASLKMADFLHNEVPGMSVPGPVRARLEKAGDGAAKAGIEIAIEALELTRKYVQGVYVMSPAGGIKSSLSVLSGHLSYTNT